MITEVHDYSQIFTRMIAIEIHHYSQIPPGRETGFEFLLPTLANYIVSELGNHSACVLIDDKV
jgi:hypothetical protein